MATQVPNSESFYYTSNESLLNKRSCNIAYNLMYARTPLTQSDEPGMLCCGGTNAV